MWEWVAAHPILTVVVVWLVCETAVQVVRAIRGDRGLAREVRALRKELSDLRTDRERLADVDGRLGRIEAREVGGPFRAVGVTAEVAAKAFEDVTLSDGRRIKRTNTPPPSELPVSVRVDVGTVRAYVDGDASQPAAIAQALEKVEAHVAIAQPEPSKVVKREAVDADDRAGPHGSRKMWR